uniref:PRKR-interacting protein 1 n=1 Tax=Globodera pallida TaxID=36090 RepID=A0A183BVI2_GLOPA
MVVLSLTFSAIAYSGYASRAKTAYDLTRIRLKRLEKNIDKPVPIPMRREEPKPKPPPEFVRNVVGSSAAAGSAEFHIFRNNKRRELERLEYIEKMAVKDELDKAFEEKQRTRKEEQEKKSSKKRMKRLRQKALRKRARTDKKSRLSTSSSSSSLSGEENEPQQQNDVEAGDDPTTQQREEGDDIQIVQRRATDGEGGTNGEEKD